LTGEFRLQRQPVVLNYRFTNARAAARVPRRDIHLRQCRQCGLIFNAAFAPEAVLYDENYENRQCFSPAFTAHLERLAQDLTQRYALAKGGILEVGCGKGDFLRLLCRTAGTLGVGFDTSFEPPIEPEQTQVEFHRSYLQASAVPGNFAAVICRHVIEHVPDIGSFLGELQAIAAAARARLVLLETPRFEWIAKHQCVWDIFYEHCNYFPSPTLAHLCRRAGFRVLRQRAVFGGQYQTLELSPEPQSQRAPRPPGIRPTSSLVSFARTAERKLAAIEQLIRRKSKNGPWGIWGAGAKGVAIINQLPQERPTMVVDSNPAKQGGAIPGTRVPIVAPDDPRLDTLKLILIANPNYAAEIRATLRERHYTGAVAIL